jgi:hypothetical protein
MISMLPKQCEPESIANCKLQMPVAKRGRACRKTQRAKKPSKQSESLELLSINRTNGINYQSKWARQP